MFYIIEMIFPVIFILVLGVIVFTFAQGIVTWNKNNHSPRLTVEAKIVARRQSITHQNQPNAGDVTGAHGISYNIQHLISYYISSRKR